MTSKVKVTRPFWVSVEVTTFELQWAYCSNPIYRPHSLLRIFRRTDPTIACDVHTSDYQQVLAAIQSGISLKVSNNMAKLSSKASASWREDTLFGLRDWNRIKVITACCV